VSDEPFIAKPKPRKRVNITLDELGDAFGQYLAHRFQTPVTGIAYSAWREDEDFIDKTTIEVHLGSRPDPDRFIGAIVFIGEIRGKATKNRNARMGGDPIILHGRLYSQYGQNENVEPRFDVVAIPNEDRTITISRVIRWEGRDAFYRTYG